MVNQLHKRRHKVVSHNIFQWFHQRQTETSMAGYCAALCIRLELKLSLSK